MQTSAVMSILVCLAPRFSFELLNNGIYIASLDSSGAVSNTVQCMG